MAGPPSGDWGETTTTAPAPPDTTPGASAGPPAGDWSGTVTGTAPAVAPDPWSWARQSALGARDITDAFGLGAVSDWMGIPRPQGVENIPHDVMSGVGGALATAAGGGILKGATAVGSVASRIGETLAAQPVRQAVVGGLAGGAQGSAAAAGWPGWAQTAAAYGTALLSGLAPGTGALVGSGVTADTQLADIARTKWGIPIYPPQLGEGLTRHTYDIMSKIPGGGGQGGYQKQVQALNAAVGRTFGAIPDANGELSPGAMITAKDALSDNYNNIGRNIGSIAYTPQFHSTLAGIESGLAGIPSKDAAPVLDEIKDLRSVQQANGGRLPADIVLNALKSGSSLSELAASTGNSRAPALAVKTALQGELKAQANPSDLALLDQTNEAWMNMRTAQKAITNGNVSPGSLANYVKNSRYQDATYKGGDLYELGTIGSRFIKPPPSSGTTEKGLGVAAAMTIPTAAGLALHGQYGAAGATLASPFALGATSALASSAMRAGAMRPTPVGNYYARALVNPAYINPLVSASGQQAPQQ